MIQGGITQKPAFCPDAFSHQDRVVIQQHVTIGQRFALRVHLHGPFADQMFCCNQHLRRTKQQAGLWDAQQETVVWGNLDRGPP
jgi:hypothetical protein